VNIKKANLALLGVLALSTHSFIAKAITVDCPPHGDIQLKHLSGKEWTATYPGWRALDDFDVRSFPRSGSLNIVSSPPAEVIEFIVKGQSKYYLHCAYTGTNFDGSFQLSSAGIKASRCALDPADNLRMNCTP